MTEKVTIIGTLNMEVFVEGIDKLPDWGKQAHVKNCYLRAAGSGPRAAFPLSCLGTKSYLIGKVGDDIYGREVLKAAAEQNLSCKGIESTGESGTGVCICLVREDGERSLVTFLGSVRTTNEELINRHYNLIEKTDFLLITGYFNLPGVKKEAWKRIFEKAKNDGKHILLDPGWDVQNWQTGRREEILALLPFVDTFLPNREEAIGLSGKNSPEEMAHYLHEAGAEEVVIKLGPEGSAGYSLLEGFIKSEAISVKAVDTTAAGEVFNAGVVWGLIQGWGLEQRLTCANTIAGLFVSDPKRKYPGLEKVQECLINKKTE